MSAQDHGNLAELALAVDKGADRLRFHMDRFYGGERKNSDGLYEVVVGIQQLYEEAVAQEEDAIYARYEGEDKRPPSAEIRHTRAVKIIAETKPELHADYHALAATIKKGEVWLRQKQGAIRALQTLHKTERELAGVR